jgi:hypothetical protein
MRGLRQAFYMAQKMGEKLGKCKILQRQMQETTIDKRRTVQAQACTVYL